MILLDRRERDTSSVMTEALLKRRYRRCRKEQQSPVQRRDKDHFKHEAHRYTFRDGDLKTRKREVMKRPRDS